MNTFFNAQHSPVGAFASFTLGCPGASGGLGLELGKPADQNIYIGVESREGGTFQALPFFEGCEDDAREYVQEGDAPKGRSRVVPFSREEIVRDYRLCSDNWTVGDLTFSIYTPTWPVPDPAVASEGELKKALVPAVFAELTIDNTQCDRDRTAFFGYRGDANFGRMREVSTDDGLVGVGIGRESAICANVPGVVAAQMFSIEQILGESNREMTHFGLGGVGALVVVVPAGQKVTIPFAVCFYFGGLATAGIDASYYYTRFFKSIEKVGDYALRHFDECKQAALEMNNELNDADLSDDQKFMIAHAVHSYYGSTEFLDHEGAPLWVVNEGQYRMINTFDLTVDQLFYEMRLNPWTVRNVLDQFTARYSYHDKARLPGDETEHPGGLSFTHDMGVGNVFSRAGHSSYERPGLTGCFSYMTHEQLVNWALCAGVYVQGTGDDEWLRDNKPVLEGCLTSLLNRDHPDPEKRNGVMSLDSSRCRGGAEITTYDSLDTSLGQARGNIYLAVKSWAVYLTLERIFAGDDLAEVAASQARRCADTILAHVGPDGSIPAILEGDCDSLIVSAIEGLVFPLFNGCADDLKPDGRFGDLIAALGAHLRAILKPGVCLFDDGGWRLSSTSVNSWLSKIYLCQFVTWKVLGLESNAAADVAHVDWLTRPENAYWAWSDQCHEGTMKGSKYYPRGVTSVLWLEGWT